MTAALTRYGYFGPPGTFTEAALEAALARAGNATADRTPFPTVARTLEAVRSGDADAGVVPMENSAEGGVSATMDALAGGSGGLQIIGEEILPVHFVLAARPGTLLTDVRRVATYVHAEAQCRGWLAANLPGASFIPAMSTAAAAAALAEQPNAGFEAAICAPLAAERYGLAVLADGVGDRPDAVTRFVVVARQGVIPEPTGADTTTLVAYLRSNRSGALLELLEQFAVRGVDLTRIESRPTGAGLGEYCFSIDLAGHVAEPRVAEALKGLHRLSAHTRFLGSYPRADRRPHEVPVWTDASVFAEADAWLDKLVSG